jgi:phytoene synthase
VSTDWAITTRVLFGPQAAAALWPEEARHAAAVLHARDTFRRKARSFWVASAFLSTPVRDDLALLYAFCRRVDDLADETSSATVASLGLDHLIDELQGRRRCTPLLAAVRDVLRRRELPLEHLLQLIEGVRSDLGFVRIADDDELLRYCYQVAGTVGLVLCGLFGARPEGRPHAIDLGIAMQLTNIVRDVAEDAGRDRVYLPATRLRAEGIDPDDFRDGCADPARVRRVLHQLLDLADRYYASADDGMRDLPVRSRPAVLVARRLYAGIGQRARRQPPAPLPGRVILTRGARVRGVVAALGQAFTPRMMGWGRVPPHDSALHRALEWWSGVSSPLSTSDT